MQKFELFLKNEKLKTYRLITLLLVVLHLLFFIFLLFDANLWKKGLGGLILIALYAAYRLIVARTSNQKFFFAQGFFLLFTIFSVFMWVFVIDAIFFALSTYAFQKIGFEFEKSWLRQKNFPGKKYRWSEIDNVVLKDSMLTIDLKNNKLIQGVIENEVDEAEFNNFVKQQLTKN